ncbi:MAG: hypothetical protein WED00_03645 [Aquisalimonadaceae bacterium]
MKSLSLLILLALLLPVHAHSGMRTVDPIVGTNGEPRDTVPVPVATVEAFIHALAEAWNRQQLEPFLDPDFPNRERVIAGFPGHAVPGTRLRILSVGPVQTVEQTRRGNALVSKVIARVRAQLEIPESSGSIRREPTTQELIIRVERWVPE